MDECKPIVPGTGGGYGPAAAVLSFNVAPDTTAAQGELTTFTAKKPQYLVRRCRLTG